MLQFVINKKDLQLALDGIAEAERRGFLASQAVVQLTVSGRCLSDDRLEFANHVIARVADNPSFNYGNLSLEELKYCRYDPETKRVELE